MIDTWCECKVHLTFIIVVQFYDHLLSRKDKTILYTVKLFVALLTAYTNITTKNKRKQHNEKLIVTNEKILLQLISTS
jgi:hypothetical protein